MRLSSSFLLILAAITATNAVASAPSAKSTQPGAKGHRVADVKALNAAAVNIGGVGVDHVGTHRFSHLASVPAHRRSAANVQALNAANIGAGHVDLKHVASIVHILSASLEGQGEEAASILQIQDHDEAVKKADVLLQNIKLELSSAAENIHGVSKGQAAVEVKALQQRTLLLDLYILSKVIEMIKTKHVPGAQELITQLSSLTVDEVIQTDIVEVLSLVEFLKSIKNVANVEVILEKVLALPDAVWVIKNLQQIDAPGEFVAALVDIKDLTSLIAAVPLGISSITSVEGSAKLVTYIETYGFDVLFNIFEFAGIPCLLKAVVEVTDSMQVLQSFKTVVNVEGFVSGVSVLGVHNFVSSIKAVENVETLVTVVKSVTASGSISKRDDLLANLPATVTGVTSELPLQHVLKSVKRALAHIDALPQTHAANVDIAQRDGLDAADVSALLGDLDPAQLANLKRAITDLSALNTAKVGEVVDALVKRGAVLGANGAAGGAVQTADGAYSYAGGAAAGMVGGFDKRDGLPVDYAVDGVTGDVDAAAGIAGGAVKYVVSQLRRDAAAGGAADAQAAASSLLGQGAAGLSMVDLNRIAAIRRSGILSTDNTPLSSLDVTRIVPALKRALIDADLLSASFTPTNYMPITARGETVTLLSDSIDTFSATISTLLPTLVKISDSFHEEKITQSVKEVFPMVADVGGELDDVVKIQAPQLESKVDAIEQVADKGVKSLP